MLALFLQGGPQGAHKFYFPRIKFMFSKLKFIQLFA